MLNSQATHAADTLQFSGAGKESQARSLPKANRQNISEAEQAISTASGAALAVLGLKRGGWGGFALAALGGAFLYRGVTGHCNLYGALGIDTRRLNERASVQHGTGIKIEKSVTINKPPEELYRYWRNFENLPRFMNHLEAVQVTDATHSHWTVKGPAGSNVEWDAEIINERENELIGWRSVGAADINNAGSVRFERAPGDRGTRVKVSLEYAPPGGLIGSVVAKLFGENPEQQVEEDLRRFKQVMETGEVTTTEDQSSGRAATSTGKP